VLGVSPTATPREIRDAYRARARMAHPDLTGDASATWMRDLNAAWDILKNADRRAAYDTAVHGPGPASGTASAAPAAPIDEREPWKGAAGPPPGRPTGKVLAFGIYAGWSLAQVARRDLGYLRWLRDRPEGRAHAAEIAQLTEATDGTGRAQDADARKGSGGRGRFQRG
jgi:curved DNA-binding protein CbpA